MGQSNASIPVMLSLISLHPDRLEGRLCPTCTNSMDLHQPDTGFPDRMLWTCNHCSTWFLMDIDPEKFEAVLVCLPDHGFFRSAMDT